LSRLRARFREIVEIDFFHSPLQKRVEELLERADSSPRVERVTRVNPKESNAYVNTIGVVDLREMKVVKKLPTEARKYIRRGRLLRPSVDPPV
jgi:hypothetical protein